MPPIAPRVPHTVTLHGETLEDDYFWLRDKHDPRVAEYLAAEDAHTQAALASTSELQSRLYQEMLARIKETDLSVPYRKGRYWYYARTEEGKQYPILARKVGALTSAEEIVPDLNAPRGTTRTSPSMPSPSRRRQLPRVLRRHHRFREYTLRVKDLRRDQDGPESIERVSSVAWAADGHTLFYVTDDDAKRAYRLWRRRRGEEGATLVREETDERFSMSIRRSRSLGYLFLDADSHTASEVSFLAANEPDGEFRVFLPRAPELEYEIDHGRETFWIPSTPPQFPPRPLPRRLSRRWSEVSPTASAFSSPGSSRSPSTSSRTSARTA
jgi:oligopeptidase B